MSTVLIIGASRGLGWEFAAQYAAAGWRVIGTARSEAGISRLRDLGVEVEEVDKWLRDIGVSWANVMPATD